MTTRLSMSSLAGIARTLVAVGTARLASMLVTTRAAGPFRTVAGVDGLAAVGCSACFASGVDSGLASGVGSGFAVAPVSLLAGVGAAEPGLAAGAPAGSPVVTGDEPSARAAGPVVGRSGVVALGVGPGAPAEAAAGGASGAGRVLVLALPLPPSDGEPIRSCGL